MSAEVKDVPGSEDLNFLAKQNLAAILKSCAESVKVGFPQALADAISEIGPTLSADLKKGPLLNMYKGVKSNLPFLLDGKWTDYYAGSVAMPLQQ